jgi:hypothetical protein
VFSGSFAATKSNISFPHFPAKRSRHVLGSRLCVAPRRSGAPTSVGYAISASWRVLRRRGLSWISRRDVLVESRRRSWPATGSVSLSASGPIGRDEQ